MNADAEATRGRILESAAALFAETGQDGASIRDVARKAGVSLSMVHHYFGSKDELYAACIEAMYAELGTALALLGPELARGDDVAAVLRRATIRAYQFARAHRTAIRILLRSAVESGSQTPAGRALLLAFLDQIAGALSLATGRPARALRLPLQSVLFLVARYAAISDEDELGAIAGGRPHRAVESHLADLAERLLLGEEPPPNPRRTER